MTEVRQTAEFSRWLGRLRDANAVARILVRIRRLEQGNAGDVKNLSGGLTEMKVDYGGGYRIYMTRRGATIVMLLCGGDKSSQRKDIARARELMESL